MKFLCGLFIAIFCLWAGIRIVSSIQFNRGCEGYLKRAADANNVELAVKQLEIALEYIENNRLTTGYTSVLYQTPDEDVGFWYANLKISLDELKKVDLNATQLEKSNLLIKLRETLLDQGSDKTSVTIPEGISIYPKNVAMAWFGWISSILAVIMSIVARFRDEF